MVRIVVIDFAIISIYSLFHKNFYYAVIYYRKNNKKAPFQGLMVYLGNKVFYLNAIWAVFIVKTIIAI
jgi:hypothetical protein